MGANCATCHFRPAELNVAGKDFLRRGFRFEEVPTPDIAPGAERGEGEDQRPLTLTEIVSILGEHGFEADLDGGSAFEGGVFELVGAAAVSPEFSLFTEVEFKVEDEEVEVEEFWGQWTSATEGNYWTARIGQFQPLLLLTNQSGGPRISLSRPEVYSGRAANGNRFRPRNRLRGLEIGRMCGDLYTYFGIGNGEGQNEEDNHMDIYATTELNLDENGSSVGFWAYFGETPVDGEDGTFTDDFHRVGVVGNCASERTKFTGALLWGENDSDPYWNGGKLDNHGFFLMGQHLCSSDTAVYARWDDFTRDLPGVSPSARNSSSRELDTDGITLGIQWWPSTYIRIVGELQFLETNGEDDDTLAIAFQWAY